MIRFKRRNTIWLAALSVLMMLVIVSSDVPADAQALLLGLFTLALVGSFIDISALGSRETWLQSLQQRSPLNRTRMSPQAKEATARASGRPGYRTPEVQLVDVGMIAAQSGSEGLVMRRTRSISKDDDGVRPFVTINVPATEADRNALVRFEIMDQNGQDQYIYEMKVFLRDGEMNILADHHLPLRQNDQIAGIGDWDLRVYIDGDLVGVHNFALTASYEERRQRLNRGRDEFYVTEPESDSQEIPLSLEELLRNQGRSNRS